MTSSADVQPATRAGRRSIEPFHTRRCASYSGSPGSTSRPRNAASSSRTAAGSSGVVLAVVIWPVWQAHGRPPTVLPIRRPAHQVERPAHRHGENVTTQDAHAARLVVHDDGRRNRLTVLSIPVLAIPHQICFLL